MFHNPLEQFEIYSVFSFIFGNLDLSITNASFILVFGFVCLIISFQLLTKSQKQKTYLFSTNLSCLIDFTFTKIKLAKSLIFIYICIILAMETDVTQERMNEFLGQLIFFGILATGISLVRLFESHHVTVVNLNDIEGRLKSTVDDVIYKLKNKSEEGGGWLTGYVIIIDNNLLYIYYKNFSLSIFGGKSFIFNSDTLSYPNETMGLKALMRIVPKKKLSEVVWFLTMNPLVFTDWHLSFRKKNFSCTGLALQSKFVLCYFNLWLFF
jgi:hypothetical protein